MLSYSRPSASATVRSAANTAGHLMPMWHWDDAIAGLQFRPGHLSVVANGGLPDLYQSLKTTG
jgi:hypothetical protein